MPDNQHLYRFESGPVVKIVVGLFIAAVVTLGVIALVTGGGWAVGLVILLAASVGVGVVLERIDPSRRREQGSEGTLDQHWGFHGRPGG